MLVRELIELLQGLDDVQEFQIAMAPEQDSTDIWSLDQISVAYQRNSHPPRGFVLFESLVSDDPDTEPEIPTSSDGSVPSTPVGEVGFVDV